RIELFRRDVDRRAKLQNRGHTSAKALDDSKLSLSNAIQQKIDRENKAERLEVDLTRVQRDLQDTHVRAPFDGFLVDVTTAVGKFVNVGDTIAKSIRADRLEARFHVSNAAFTQFLADGNYRNVKAKVMWAGQTYDVVLDRIESQVQTASGGVEVFARIDGVTVDTNLRPGAFVEVLVPGPVYKAVVRIPEEALYGNDTVYRIVQNRLEPHKVEIVARDGKDLLVRGTFDAKDRVVTTRFPEIGPGLKVKVP
ncbi:MAG: efflux RND transporter periplasmic adaptor subunit, partial [Methyloligellaceae bacterium]